MPAIPIARLKEELRILYKPALRAKATWGMIRQVLEELTVAVGLEKKAAEVEAVDLQALEARLESSELTSVAIAKWLGCYPDRSVVRAHSLLRSLRAVMTYAVEQKYVDVDPFAWRTPAEWLSVYPEDLEPEEPFDRHLSVDQVLRILNQADVEASSGTWESGRLQALTYTYAYTGMRKKEALRLKVSDVDLVGGLIEIRLPRRRAVKVRRLLKTRGSAASLGIAEPLGSVLAMWLPRCGGEWLFPGKRLRGPWMDGGPGVRALDQIKALGLRAGVEGLTILAFRHTIGTLAEGLGLGELELQRWLRHLRRRTQDSYRKRGDDTQIRATAAKIRFGAG